MLANYNCTPCLYVAMCIYAEGAIAEVNQGQKNRMVTDDWVGAKLHTHIVLVKVQPHMRYACRGRSTQ